MLMMVETKNYKQEWFDGNIIPRVEDKIITPGGIEGIVTRVCIDYANNHVYVYIK